MSRSVPSRLSTPRPLAACLATVVIAAAAAWSGEVRGEVVWHADLQAACAASAASGKPVLAVFDATWAAAEPEADVLANPEVEAVVGACFEPVRLDVDRHADLARELTVDHVPAARVLDHEAALLAGFDCPSTPSAFVAAAARAAQVAAASTSPEATATTAEATDAFGSQRGAKAHETAAAVSQKVRQLANFAGGDPSIPAPARRFAELASALPAASPVDPVVGSRYAETVPAPALANNPPAWPAQQPVAAPTTPAPAAPVAAVATGATIEPQPTAATPWLAGTPASAGPATPPAASAAPTPLAAPGPSAAASAATIAEDGSQPASKPASGYWAALQKPWSIFAKSPATVATQPPAPPPTMPPARPQSPAALTAQTPAPDTHGPMPLGLEGYCPVTVVERGSWVEGRPQWGARHRGRTYLFAGPEQQQAFLADPDRYAPALSGDDPVLAFESGRSEPGRRAYGVSYQSRMYLFSSPESRAAFTADPDRYTSRVMIAEGTAPADSIRRF